MTSIATTVLDLQQLDLLARADTPIHRLDARAKVLVTLLFCVSVMSFGRYEVAPLLPFLAFPLLMIARSGLPPLFILRKIALLCPFVIAVALFNPLVDRAVVAQIGSIDISGGWLSFLSIMLRSLLTVGSALTLVGVTGFAAICEALAKLGFPRIFTTQLLFLYRYIFVLAEEAGRAAQARELRSFGSRGRGTSSFGPLVGHLFLRTWDRAERIHQAMLARGFDGALHGRAPAHFGRAEALYLAGWTTAFVIMRCSDPARLLGLLVMGVTP